MTATEVLTRVWLTLERWDVVPTAAAGGVPTCHERCPQFDGKRCRWMGVRAPLGHVCEAWAETLHNVLREATETTEEPQS